MAAREKIEELQKRIASMESSGRVRESTINRIGLGKMESAFAEKVFPVGAVHEFISPTPESAACTSSFLAGVNGLLMRRGGPCIWVSTHRKVYPPGLTFFGIDPSRILFVEVKNAKDGLWVIEEALKCSAVTSVVGEVYDLTFNYSRRLQLAVEKSGTTGFIHRFNPRQENAVACATRWKITPVSSAQVNGMPGVGFPRWMVELHKVRSGRPGCWLVEWSQGGLHYIDVAGDSNVVRRTA
jgi:protein ImuA